MREAIIKLGDGDFEFIELWRTDSRFVTWFTIAYLVTVQYNYNKKDLTTSLGAPTSAFHERCRWMTMNGKADHLARMLNSDMTLKEMLISNKGQIEVRYEPKGHIVAVTEVVGDSYPDPEPEHIGAIERILAHARTITSRNLRS